MVKLALSVNPHYKLKKLYVTFRDLYETTLPSHVHLNMKVKMSKLHMHHENDREAKRDYGKRADPTNVDSYIIATIKQLNGGYESKFFRLLLNGQCRFRFCLISFPIYRKALLFFDLRLRKFCNKTYAVSLSTAISTF